jgi:hypothetical protein
MLKYVSKFAMDILPSVVATIIGAYIVNHYVVTKPGADAPVAAAVSTADPKAAKATETSTDVANLPQPGVRAKGISEKSISEKAIIERSAVEKPIEKAQEKSADTPAETAAIPADPRRHPPAPREKAIAKATPVQPAAPAVVAVAAVPTTAAPATGASVEVAVPAEEHRDANDLARAAIERLRGSDGAPRAQEAARTPDAPIVVAPRVADVPRVAPAPTIVVAVPPVRPLPPPIMVSTPSAETFDSAAGPSQMRQQPYAGAARIDDPRRPTPPADIPVAGPLDLRADAGDPSTRQHTTVAEDMLLAAKSVFHAVLPK